MRRVAVPLDARIPTHVSATVEADRCLNALVLASDELSHVELSVLDQNGHLLGRSTALGRDRSLVVCSPLAVPVSFEIRPGETFCIVAENGSGKSTLLQMVAGILLPTSGTVSITGRVSALLELGSGFNPEFSGRDNVYLNGAIFGLSREYIDAHIDEILDFSEIAAFADQPVRTY